MLEHSRGSRRGVQKHSRRSSKFKRNFELLGVTGLRVLDKLGAGSTAADTAKAIGCCKSNVSYWKDRLLDIGALRLQCRSVYSTYSLTPYGSKLLTRSERKVVVAPVCLEDHAVKFAVVESEKLRVDWRKLGRPQNWQKLGILIGNIRVVKTSRSIIIHPGKLRGFDVDELEVTAGRIIERTRALLENRFGMVLSLEGVPLHKPMWQVFSPEAEEWVKAGTVRVEGVGQLDKSPPDRHAHREYDRKELAVDAVNAPVILVSIEEKIDALSREIPENIEGLKVEVESINVNLVKLTTALNKLLDLESSPTLSPQGEKVGLDRYVS